MDVVVLAVVLLVAVLYDCNNNSRENNRICCMVTTKGKKVRDVNKVAKLTGEWSQNSGGKMCSIESRE